MRKAVLHAEGRICKHPGCNVRLSIYNPGKTCSVHPEVLSIKEARRALVVESTDKEKARMRRYKARVRAGIVKPKKRYKVTAWARRLRGIGSKKPFSADYEVKYQGVASKLLDKAIAKSMKRVNAEVVKAMAVPARYLEPDRGMTATEINHSKQFYTGLGLVTAVKGLWLEVNGRKYGHLHQHPNPRAAKAIRESMRRTKGGNR